MNKQEPIKVALVGMNARTQSLLDIFFSGRGRGHGCIVEESSANAAIIDMDYPGSEAIWERYHSQHHWPSIVFSFRELDLPDSVWVSKPININDLVVATDKLELLLQSSHITPPAATRARAVFHAPPPTRPKPEQQPTLRRGREAELQVKIAAPAKLRPEERPQEPKSSGLEGKNRWTDPFEERLKRYQAMAKAAPVAEPPPRVQEVKRSEPVALRRPESKGPVSLDSARAKPVLEAASRAERVIRPVVQPKPVTREEVVRESVALDRGEARAVAALPEPQMVAQQVAVAAVIAPVPVVEVETEEVEEIRHVEPAHDWDVQPSRRQDAVKANGQGTHIHEEHFAIDEDFCERFPDVDLSDPDQRETILFSPEAYLLGDVISAFDAARKTHRPVLIEALRERIVFFPESNLLFTTFDPLRLREICEEPLHRSEVSTHILGDRESIVLEDQISGGKLVNADTFLWSMSIWTSQGRLPRDFNLGLPVTLKHWPNLTRLPPTPHAMRIASFWSQRAATLEETARVLEIPQRCVFAFFNAANALGRLKFTPGAKSQGGLTTHSNRGLFSKLLHKLGRG